MRTIRSILILTTLLSAGCRNEPSGPTDEQRHAIATLRELGAKVVLDDHADGSPVVKIDLGCVSGGEQVVFVRPTRVEDSSLTHLGLFPGLRELCLRGTPISDRGLDHLRTLVTLHTLDLSGTRVTDRGVEKLTGLTELRELSVAGLPVRQTAATDGIADTLLGPNRQPTTPTADPIARSGVTGRGLAHLSGLPRLERLDLSFTQVTDADLTHLRPLSRLRVLKLRGDDITGVGLTHLAGAAALEELDLSFTGVTGPDLRHLDHLPKLRLLTLVCTDITDGEVDEYKRANPRLVVRHIHAPRR